jgi:hypothetical protein
MPDKPQESAEKKDNVVVINIKALSRSEAKRLKAQKGEKA